MVALNASGIWSQINRSTQNGRLLSSKASRSVEIANVCSVPTKATRSRSDEGLALPLTLEPYAQTMVSGMWRFNSCWIIVSSSVERVSVPIAPFMTRFHRSWFGIAQPHPWWRHPLFSVQLLLFPHHNREKCRSWCLRISATRLHPISVGCFHSLCETVVLGC